MKKLRVVELYAGTARSVEPFRYWKRAEIALLVDASRHARKTYLLNFPRAPYVRRSLSAATSSDLLSWAKGRVDVLLGCPPCQGFSDNGSRREDDPRNMHIRRFARFAVELRPMAVAMENVPAVAASREYQLLVNALERAGYRWSAMVANSAQYGSCQSRQRLLLIAFREDLGENPIFPKPTHGGEQKIFSYSTLGYRRLRDDPLDMLGLTPTSQRVSKLMPVNFLERVGAKPIALVSGAFDGLPSIGSSEANKMQHLNWSHSQKILRRMKNVPEGERWRGGEGYYAHTYGRLHRKGLARTITTCFPYAGGGRFWHPTENRSLSLREAARIQGFPDEFLFSDSSKKSAALVGNALDYSLASICYKVIRRALE